MAEEEVRFFHLEDRSYFAIVPSLEIKRVMMEA